MPQTQDTEIRVGDSVELNLPEMGAAGYLWDVSSIRNSSVASVRETVRNEAESAAPVGERAIGGRVTRRFTLCGERVGEFRMTHSRPWIKPQEGDESITIRVTPRADGPVFHDFYRGMKFSFKGVGWFCKAVVDNCVLAERESDATLRLLEPEEVSGILLIPYKIPSPSWNTSSISLALVRSGALWRQRNGGLYVIISRGLLEADGAEVVTYRSMVDGKVWVRSLDEFLGDSDGEPRFVYLFS